MNNIVLTGFMGTGKTTVGKLIAEKSGRRFVDSDSEIEQSTGHTVSHIFKLHGEAHFRALEQELCYKLADSSGCVIGTGGGMPLDMFNRKLLNKCGPVFNLKTEPDVILKRVGKTDDRPLLRCKNPQEQIGRLLAQRKAVYDSFPFQIDTGTSNADEVAELVLKISRKSESIRFLNVSVPIDGGYSILLGKAALSLLGHVLANRGMTAKIGIITDSNVAPLYLDQVIGNLKDAGFSPFAVIIPAGESSKSLDTIAHIYSDCVRNGLDRRGAIVGLGGGVVGDVSGFVAATYMRGIAYVQCPTTLLAMVDSSVGGKTGVDLPEGKNLVGAFKQPIAVVADTRTLETLPDSEVRNGTAESIKHGIIGDPNLFEQFCKGQISPTHDQVVAQSVQVKIKTVEQDPLEQGMRATLNLGHTIGHAVEKLSNYTLPHGNAVSIGLVAAARMSEKMALCSRQVVQKIEQTLSHHGLPTGCETDPDLIMDVMRSDKKSIDQIPRFVLIKGIGEVVYGCRVDPEIIKKVLIELNQSQKVKSGA